MFGCFMVVLFGSRFWGLRWSAVVSVVLRLKHGYLRDLRDLTTELSQHLVSSEEQNLEENVWNMEHGRSLPWNMEHGTCNKT